MITYLNGSQSSLLMRTLTKNNTFLSLLFAMFIFTTFLLLLSYTDTANSFQKSITENNILYGFHDEREFEVQLYTWKCEKEKCVKTLTQTEPVSLTTCSMTCSEPQIWPKPTNLKIINKNSSIINPNRIQINYSSKPTNLLQNASDLFLQNFKSRHVYLKNALSLTINILVIDLEVERLKLSTNESYHLRVESRGNVTVSILAQNFFGARHALETLAQLIWYDEVANALMILHDVNIIDSPKFPYRGISLDTARNYFPISLIKKVVDGMAMSKLNSLHLHLTDSVSFPVVLPKAMQLASFGAYGPQFTYPSQDIRDLVQYARIRGIRVILEVDAPGHVNAGWNFGERDYVICGDDDILNGHLNPDNDDVMTVLEDIYSDLLEMSDNNEMFHLGSDEVNLTCWKQTKAAKNSHNNMKSFWAKYTNQMLERLKVANGEKFPDHVIMWSSPLTASPELEKLDFKVTVQHWLGDPTTILKQGHNVIYSTVGHWYLDCGFGPWKSTMKSGVCDPYRPWQEFYNYRPWITYGHQNLVLGGEVCLWSEQVSVDTLETRIWPRAAAFAERVWSDPESNNNQVFSRLVGFSERLKSRGIETAAIWPFWCSQNPGKC